MAGMRKYARGVARSNMKRQGMVRFNKKNGEHKESWFSVHWREYTNSKSGGVSSTKFFASSSAKKKQTREGRLTKIAERLAGKKTANA